MLTSLPQNHDRKFMVTSGKLKLIYELIVTSQNLLLFSLQNLKNKHFWFFSRFSWKTSRI